MQRYNNIHERHQQCKKYEPIDDNLQKNDYLCINKCFSGMHFRNIYTCLTLLVALALLSCKGMQNKPASPVVDTIPMLVTQIQKCSRLYTAECHVHKIVTHEDKKTLKGKLFNHEIDIDLPLGERKVAIPIDVTLKAYIDFSDFSSASIERQGKKIGIVLPDPRIKLTASKVDHQAVKKYVALTRSNFTDAELADYERQGRASVVNNLPETRIIEQARESAATILIPMLRQMGYEESDITIHFRKQLNTRDLSRLIDISSTEHGKKQ